MIETRPARFADARALAPRLRFEDAGEIAATWGLEPCEGLCLCLLQSDRAFALVEAAQVLALWGVGGARAGGLELGIPWLLAADGLFSRRREFLRRSRGWVDRLLLDYDLLTNLTLARNTAHLRWLAWCGFRALRVHRRHGSAGLPYCEFYRINALRHEDDAGVRETLLGRVPAQQAQVDPLLLQAARFAARGFAVDALHELLASVQARRRADGRLRPALAALFIEAAGSLCRRPDAGVEGVDRQWCENLLALQETALLADGGCAEKLVFALDVPSRCAARLPSPGGGRAGAETIAGGAATLRGLAGLAALTRGYVACLTLGGRVSRVQGRWLRTAAIGLDEAAARRPLGIPQQHLIRTWARGRPFAGGSRPGFTARDRLPPGRLAERFRETVRDDLVGRALARALDDWACGALVDPPPGAESTDAGAASALLADRVARRLLPSTRLGGVVGGFGDRQHVYWLIRTRLLAVSAEAGDILLAGEIGALLVAARAEERLLTLRGARFDEQDDLAAVLESITEVFGADPVRAAGDMRELLATLAPAFSMASLHGVQLAAALLSWHLAKDGAVEDVLREVSGCLSYDEADSRGRLRRYLGGLARQVSSVSLERHVAGSSRCDTVTPQPWRKQRGLALHCQQTGQ